MNGLKEQLMEEEKRLAAIEQKVEEELGHMPNGKLRLSNSRGYIKYYHCTDKSQKRGKYIQVGDKNLVKQLSQKEYDEKIIAIARKRRKQIQRIIKDYNDDEIERVFLKQHPERQRLIIPVEPTWDQMMTEWMREQYTGKGFEEGTTVILSERGERVRSKSEKIIADFLFNNNIPYKYERHLKLKGAGIIFPDFTILSPKTRKEVLWEHFGLMDDPQYAQNAIRKINCYEENEILIGESLITTFETTKTVLNTKILHQIAALLTP